MKVIVASFSKCGTKTMAAALRQLGLVVYDFLENYEFLGRHWNEILEHGGSPELFRRMYEGVDAVTDVPCCLFWEELLQAFPEAKVRKEEGGEGGLLLELNLSLRSFPFSNNFIHFIYFIHFPRF